MKPRIIHASSGHYHVTKTTRKWTSCTTQLFFCSLQSIAFPVTGHSRALTKRRGGEFSVKDLLNLQLPAFYWICKRSPLIRMAIIPQHIPLNHTNKVGHDKQFTCLKSGLFSSSHCCFFTYYKSVNMSYTILKSFCIGICFSEAIILQISEYLYRFLFT